MSLSAERDPDKMQELILNVAMDLTNCDAGTLYIKEDDGLYFKIMITRSMGGKIENMNLPPVKINKSNVCACALIEKRVINLSDVSTNKNYDFSGPRKYDSLIGYKTRSMLVVPMINNKGEDIGVIQLINALSSSGEVVDFEQKDEIYVSALTSQAAISLTNANQQIEIENLLHSLVRALSAAIYERSPYNVTHTQNMTDYAERFVDWLVDNFDEYKFLEQEKKQLIMSVWLHDVGKLGVPLEVMNKATRLDADLERLMTRLDFIELTAKLEEALGVASYEEQKKKLEYVKSVVLEANSVPFLNDELENKIKEISRFTYKDLNGETKNWITEKETTALLIKRGTLTEEERRVMETHVVMTSRILEQVSFGKEYASVCKWAGEHHEFLDGSGYPNKLSGKDLSIPTRIITIIDVFDGLYAKDRPYKKPISIENVANILNNMAEEGKVDKVLLSLFFKSKVWEL